MKKQVVLWLVVVAMSVGMVGCGSAQSEGKVTEAFETTVEATDVSNEAVQAGAVSTEQAPAVNKGVAEPAEMGADTVTAPTKEEVLAMREAALAGMSEEAIKRLTENISVANRAMEEDYLNDDLFGKLSDPKNLYWNYFDQKEEIQIGWSVPTDVKYDSSLGMTYEEYKEQYGDPIMEYNRFDADNFIALMEEMRGSLQKDLLKADLDALIKNTKLARETHEVQYAVEIYHILHDMDYFLLRYGPEDVGQYTQDDSLVSTYYGALKIYE